MATANYSTTPKTLRFVRNVEASGFSKKKRIPIKKRTVSLSLVNYPAAELRGIKIQNLFPYRHFCASRNPVYVGPLFSKEQAWIPTFVGMTDEVTLCQATWNYQFKTLKHFVFGEPVFIRPAELGGIQQVSFINDKKTDSDCQLYEIRNVLIKLHLQNFFEFTCPSKGLCVPIF